MKCTYDEFMKAYALFSSMEGACNRCVDMLNTALSNKDVEGRLWHDAEMGFYTQMNVAFTEVTDDDGYWAEASDGRTGYFDLEDYPTSLISGAVNTLWTDYERLSLYARAVYNYLGVKELEFNI